jgi:hypothetical protein
MTPEEQAKLQKLANEVGDDAALLKQVIAHYKAGGFKAVAQDVPAIVIEARKDYAALSDALPVVKAGYKTTEFWLVVLVMLGNGIYFGVTGKTLPFDLNATLASMVGIYTVVRGLMKKPAAPAAPAEVAPVALPTAGPQAVKVSM